MKKAIAGFTAAATCCFAFALCACGDEGTTDEPKIPEKLRDGEAVSLVVGGSHELDMTKYISIAGTDATYSVASSKPEVATVALTDTTAKITAVSRGTSTVTASAGELSVDFAVTVQGKPASFDNGAIAYDLRTAESGTLTLAPKANSGESTYNYTYTLKAANENASITGNTLTVTYDAPVTETLTVNVSYTDSQLPNVAARKAEFTVSVNVTDTTPTLKAPTVEKEVDAATLTGETYDIDLAENILNPGNLPLTYSVKVDENEAQTIEGATYSLAKPETVPDGGVEHTIAVTAAYGTGESEKLNFVYKVKFIDVSAYQVQNGGFDNDLTGWTASADEFGEISEAATYWETLPMHNDGKYFKTKGTGTLTSPYFTVGGIDKISFKLGSGGKSGCYVTLENEDGEVLRIWRNYKFEDSGASNPETTGTTKFIENFVTYIADLSDLHGERVRIVIHDEEAVDDGFGIINFDSLVTYYAGENDLPTADKQDGRPVFNAENELADMTELKALIAECAAITEQGDYTEASYTAFTEKLAAAQAVANNIASKKAAVDNALTELSGAKLALTYREPTEKDNADKNFKILAGENKQISLADYVDTKQLSEITYEVVSADTTMLTATRDGDNYTLAVPDTVTGSHPVTVTLTVKHKGETVLTVTLTVTATNEAAATLKNVGGIDKSYDLYDEKVTDKEKMTLDFAENVDNPKNLTLAYSVTVNGGEVQALTGSTHEFTFGEYTETVTTVTFHVTIAFTVDSEAKSIEYDYVLHLTDTRAYRIKNGGFDLGEDGLDNWTLDGGNIGAVNNVSVYWTERGKFNNDGNFFNGYTRIEDVTIDEVTYKLAMGGDEGAKGTLTSDPFTLGGSGWITYKLGGAKNADRVYLEVVDSATGDILDRFHNNVWADETDGKKTGCSMTLFKADLHDHIGKTVYIRITDNATYEYGLFFVDSFETYYTAEPQDTETVKYVKAESKVQLKYSVINGGFELGNLEGWTMDGNIGAVSNANGYWGDAGANRPELFYQKEGNWFFEGRENKVAQDAEGEWKVGSLTSSTFVLGGSGWITFYMGAAQTQAEQYIEIVDAQTNTVLARYSNKLFQDMGNYSDPRNNAGAGQNYVSALTLIKYKADLSKHVGKKLYIRVVDSHIGGGFGMTLVDNFVTYYEKAEDIGAEYNLADNKVTA